MPLPTLLEPGNLKIPAGHEHERPVDYIVKWVKQHSPDFGGKRARIQDRVLIVQSKTGSGKSTALPVYLFRIWRSKATPARQKYTGKSILCTQPRVLTAIDISSKEIPGEPDYSDMVADETKGKTKTIGYQTGSAVSAPPAGLIFATVGILTQQLRTMEDSELMSLYHVIIVDEAHERSRDLDITLMLLKAFYARNEGNANLPFLLLASATFDVDKYAAYFGLTQANTVSVGGRAYGIEDHFPTKGSNDYTKDAAAKAIEIHESSLSDKPEKADIMIFLPGAAEIKEIEEGLTSYLKQSPHQFLVLPISGEAVREEARAVYLVKAPLHELPEVNSKKPIRRIVLTTSVAETGLTVPSLRYVIDAGWSRETEAYQPYGISGLVTRPASRSRILQRKGRAGRKFPGDFYPIYTENVFNSLEEQQLPEIITAGVTPIFASIVGEQQRLKKKRGVLPEFRVEDIDMLDPPPVEAIRAALEFNLSAGFVSPTAIIDETYSGTQRGYGLTWLGQIAGKFTRTPIEGVRAILSCYVWGCSVQDMITIVALFSTPMGDLLDEDSAKKDNKGTRTIRECLPSFLVGKTVGGAEESRKIPTPPSADDLASYRGRIAIADSYIEELLVIDAFADYCDAADGDLFAINDWCAEKGLSLEKLLDEEKGVIAKREMYIEELLTAGLDPFWGADKRLRATPMNQFIERVSMIKRCLYDGLRANVLVYDEKTNVYKTRFGLSVDVPPMFSDKELTKLALIGIEGVKKPKYILTDSISMKLDKKKAGPTQILYRLKAKMTSVLDGFVSVDSEFLMPRPAVPGS